VAALDVPIIKKAVDWWRGQHPTVFKPGESNPLHPKMAQAFGVCVLTFMLFFVLLVVLRYRAAGVEDRAQEASERLAVR
jgi:cbb3-type cytochrome oxidase subunit 3